MKTLKWGLLVALVTGVSVWTIKLGTRSPRLPSTGANQLAEVNERDYEDGRSDLDVGQATSLATTPVRKLACSVVALTPDNTNAHVPDIRSQHANVLRIRADQVLAKVNDRTVLLKDLVPLRADEQEQAMTSEEYESRLNRAIETELTFQAAAARGVDLTSGQKKRVDDIAHRHEATLQQYQKQGVTWSSVTPTQVEFEKRLTSALMLQQNLVAAEAHFVPASDPSRQARYEQARSEVLSRLKAKGKINISAVGF